jgi:proline iminopeptidase
VRNVSLCFLFSVFVFIYKASGQEKDSIYYVKQKSAGVKRITIDNKFWVWTQKIGKGKINLLLLHGGPGQTHEYFENFSKFLPPAGITIYYYDQFGSYYSETPTEQQLDDTLLWKISRYVEEVEQVRKRLRLKKLFVYGHSYGALLALAYTDKYSKHIQGLIFSNMNPNQKKFGEDIRLASARTDSILSATPSSKELMQRKQNRQPYDTLLYENLFEQTFTRHFVVRLDSLSNELVRTKNHKNQQVAEKIGSSTFSLNYADMIRRISVPVFVMSGKYDFIIRPEETVELSKSFKNSTYYIAPEGGHISFVDDAANYFSALIKFIKSTGGKR